MVCQLKSCLKEALILMKIVSFLIFFSTFVDSKQLTFNLIVENCKGCHNLNSHDDKRIPSLNDLKKKEFIELMIRYKSEKKSEVMHRISKVLSDNDINQIADLIYD